MKLLAFKFIIYAIFLKILIIIIFITFVSYNKNNFNHIVSNNKNQNQDLIKNFDYVHYEFSHITEKIKNDSGWLLNLNQASLINGLIRKHKPKNCLEIGVAKGGSSILILNAIKDLNLSRLISIDLFTYSGAKKKIGYLVQEKFPELMIKWKLFLGEMPYKILSELNIKFDFVFLDTAHRSPGEFINFIEILPFLNENAIIVLHDIIWHYNRIIYGNFELKDVKIMPTQIYLMSSLIGEKLILYDNKHDFENIGVIRLDKHQERYYLNYFLLLMTIWEYLPSDEQLYGLRLFVQKYYKDKLLLKIFDNSVDKNKIFYKKFIAKKKNINRTQQYFCKIKNINK